MPNQPEIERPRARDVGIKIGSRIPGALNAITDVAGVRVGHSTILRDFPGGRGARTGVTVVEPRSGLARLEPCFAGVHVLNGNGDACGLEWIREAGLLASQIAITNTHSVGIVRDSLIAMEREALGDDQAMYWSMPVVMETFDGVLNDINGFHVAPEHVREAVRGADGGAVAEGSVGGGTGMICYEFKGGIGTSSRRLSDTEGGWMVGALVQANHGKRASFSVNGIPVGRYLTHETIPSPFLSARSSQAGMGSIVVILATDAPLLPHQCKRLAQRASIGLARSGGGTDDSSGDIFIAFSTGNEGLPVVDYARVSRATTTVTMVNNDHMSGLFEAAAEAVEEAILNALLAATTVEGCGQRVARALTAQTLLGSLADLSPRLHAVI